jgi:hypothetical protein
MTSSDSDSSNDANIQVYWGLLQRQQALAQIGRYLAKIQQYRESVAKKDKKDEKITGNTSLSKIKNSGSSSEKDSDDFDDVGQVEDQSQLYTDESGNKQYGLFETTQRPDRDIENQEQKNEESAKREAKENAERELERERVAKENAEREAKAEREAEAKRKAEAQEAEAKRKAEQKVAQAQAHAQAPVQASAQMVIQPTIKSGLNAYEDNLPQELLEIKTRIDKVTEETAHMESILNQLGIDSSNLNYIQKIITRCEMNLTTLTNLLDELVAFRKVGSQELNKESQEINSIQIFRIETLAAKTKEQIKLAKERKIQIERAKQQAEEAEREREKVAEKERAASAEEQKVAEEQVEAQRVAKKKADLALAQEKEAQAQRAQAEADNVALKQMVEQAQRTEAQRAKQQAEITASATQRNAGVLGQGSDQALLRRRDEVVKQRQQMNKINQDAVDSIARHPSNLPKKSNTGFVHSLTKFFSPASAKQGETKKIYEDLEAWQECIHATQQWKEALDALDTTVRQDIWDTAWQAVMDAQAKSVKAHNHALGKRNEVLRKKIGETIYH